MKQFRNLTSIIVILMLLTFATSTIQISSTSAQDDKCLSEVTVSISHVKTQPGSPVTISGTVLDVSPRIVENELLKLRFPNGVPVVSDEIIDQWLRYVHYQYERPAEVIGVDITVIAESTTTDETINIGTTTSDEHGIYSIVWTPENEDEYDIWAYFEGNKGYYGADTQSGSYAQTTITESPYGWYIIGAAIAIIAIIISATLVITKKPRKK